MGISKIQIPQEELAEYCRRWGVAELSLFGSVLRDDFGPKSDIDVLVGFAQEASQSILNLARVEHELSVILGRRVDLVERRAVELSDNYIRRRHILDSVERVYVAG